MSEYREPGSTASCLHCKKPFVLNSPNQLYCSTAHALKEQRKRRRLRDKGVAMPIVAGKAAKDDVSEAKMAELLRINKQIKEERSVEAADEAAATLKDVFGYVGPRAVIDIPKEDDTKQTEDEQKAKENKGLEDV